MKSLFARNMDKKGRIVRGLCAPAVLTDAESGFEVSVWLGLVLLGSGMLVAFEAIRGWCGLRACGMKTKF